MPATTDQMLATGGTFTTEEGSVYAPSDDTYVLIDAIEKDRELLSAPIGSQICVEIGCGSGAVITSVAKMLGPKNWQFIATDINEQARRATKQLGIRKGLGDCLQLTKGDLGQALLPKYRNKVDLLIFNPPFCPSDPSEVGIVGKGCSFRAGVKGRQVMDRFMPYVSSLLSPSGVLYMTAIKRNDVPDIGRTMGGLGFEMSVAMERVCDQDTVYALKFAYQS